MVIELLVESHTFTVTASSFFMISWCGTTLCFWRAAWAAVEFGGQRCDNLGGGCGPGQVVVDQVRWLCRGCG